MAAKGQATGGAIRKGRAAPSHRAMTDLPAAPASPIVAETLAAWRRLAAQRRLYSFFGLALVFGGLAASLWFADDANAGHFFERLPHLFDFLSWLVPDDWNDVWRALFDIDSPNVVPGQEFDFPLGRVPIFAGLYLPEYFQLMLVTINVALVSTLVGFLVAVPLSFVAARNLTPSHPLRLVVKRVDGTAAGLSRDRHRRPVRRDPLASARSRR